MTGTGRLAGKCAIVTGGASGIGLAAAQLFAREGARVVIADLAGAEEAAAEIARGVAAAGGAAAGITVDVTSEDDVARMAEAAGERIDVLYANAGIEGAGAAHDLERAAWERVIAVNLTGVWLSVRAVLPAMMRTGGSIVTQSSTAGLVGVAGLAAYSAAKGGVIALTRQLAVEYGRHGIRANAICPGTVWTPLVERTLAERGLDAEEAMASAGRGYPLKRFGTPEEVAAFALFLASDESAWITGGAFAADGGYTAR
jgi:NAD(P)-dependent dehydrogenase (short-subunit alcohol dehydrogenase family)